MPAASNCESIDVVTCDEGFSLDAETNSCISETLGCTDATARNFNPAATKDDGSCKDIPALNQGSHRLEGAFQFDGVTYI